MKLDTLEDTVRGFEVQIIVAGDLNAQAVEWELPDTDHRGRLILEIAARVDLSVINIGSTTTFRRPGTLSSIPDITLVTPQSHVIDWQVIEVYNGSDHHTSSSLPMEVQKDEV